MKSIGHSLRFMAVLALIPVIGVIGIMTGCDNKDVIPEKDFEIETLVAKYTDVPVEIDGILDDSAWSDARVYQMHISKDRDGEVQEGGGVMLAWDKEYLYVGAKLYDSDIVAEGDEDQLHHYLKGDTLEVFLKPEKQTWYWEAYVTPRGKKTSFFLPGRGRLWLDSMADYSMDMKVGASYKGTLNNWKDRDEYWIAEMAIPISALTEQGDDFGPSADWRILIARYNYSRYLSRWELSTAPQLPMTDFHRYEYYGILKLVE